MNDIAITPVDGYTTREVLVDSTTTLEMALQRAGSDVTPDSGTLAVNLVSGSLSPQALSVTEATGSLKADVTATAHAALERDVWCEAEVQWECEVAGVQVRTVERITVVAHLFRWPLLYSWITDRYDELKETCALPEGQSNLWPRIRLELEELRNWLDDQGAQRRIWTIRDHGIIDLVKYAAWYAVADFQAQKQQRQGRWDVERETMLTKFNALKKAKTGRFATSVTEWGEAPSADRLRFKGQAPIRALAGRYGGIL